MQTSPSALALLLGRAGLLPFVAGAALVALGPPEWRSKAAWALAAYAAVIVSFLGGIHWGLAFRLQASADPAGKASKGLLTWGVVPSLLAWPATLWPPGTGLAVLGASLWLCYAVDRRLYPAQGAAAWLGLRLLLTTVASLCCWAGAAALMVA
jgi:hypothetical protein